MKGPFLRLERTQTSRYAGLVHLNWYLTVTWLHTLYLVYPDASHTVCMRLTQIYGKRAEKPSCKPAPNKGYISVIVFVLGSQVEGLSGRRY